MKINLRYYCALNGKYNKPEGELVLKNRRVISNGLDSASPTKPRKFFYDETDMNIMLDNELRTSKVRINAIITESDYSSTQREYFVQLSGIQKHKLQWMFRRHWLQQTSNFIHLMVALFLVLMVVVTIDYLTGHL